MFIDIQNNDLYNINKKNTLELLKNKSISLDTYNKWIYIIDTFKDDQKKIYKTIYRYKFNKNLHIYNIIDINEPNFIILCSGQSNAGGWGSEYDHEHPFDQPHPSIQSYNVMLKKWVIADLNNESLGHKTMCRNPGSNTFVFQFAHHLLKNYPGIKPGIINVCDGGKPISNWSIFDKDENFYDENYRTSQLTNKKYPPGFIFEQILDIYNEAMLQLSTFSNKKVNVVLWHQGESDNIFHSNLEYFQIAFNKVIQQFSNIDTEHLTPFIAGTILNYYEKNTNSDPYNDVIRNKNNNKFYSFCELSNLESLDDKLHFTTESIRTAGQLYFDEYQKLTKLLVNNDFI